MPQMWICEKIFQEMILQEEAYSYCAGCFTVDCSVHNTPLAVQPRHVAIDPVRFVKTADGYRLEVCGPTTSKVPIDVFK